MSTPRTFATVTVVFLARGVDQGLHNTNCFLASYDRFRPRLPHRLVIAVKGWEFASELDYVRLAAESRDASVVELPDDGYDWGAYARIASQLTGDLLFFLNGSSRILAGNWLDIMMSAAKKEKVGAVGASGSFGTLSPHVIGHWTDLALFPVRYARMALRFPSFPNPHLRSNAFLTRRDLFVTYINGHEFPRTKEDAHVMECGRDGYCRFLGERGYTLVVAGRDGNLYAPESWIKSNTYCAGDQDNLLISDNRTEQYRLADSNTRDFLERSIWGKRVTS